MTYGLIGYPLSHSFSWKYFNEKFKRENIKNAEYKNFEIPNINELHEVIKNNPKLQGFNVTIPYKESIIPLLDHLDDTAKEIGAVNCVKLIYNADKPKLIGYNTDYYGFSVSLKQLVEGKEKTALIFGSGGASKAVKYSLRNLDINYKIVSRQLQNKSENTIKYEDISPKLISETDILINTTPLGMFPNIDNAVDIPYEYIKNKSIAFDLIYNPLKTLFLKKAEENGAIICNGLKMLELQADKAWEIFNT